MASAGCPIVTAMGTILVILCHPNAKSLNHAVADALRSRLEAAGHAVRFHDLYSEGFDPALSFVELKRRFSFDELVQRHYRDVEEADGFVFVHPEWWSQPPAMLKGWIDRVLAPGIGYDFEGEEFMTKSKVPLLAGKRALVLATTDSAPPASGTEPLLASIWRETLGYCGIGEVQFRMLYRVRDIEPAERREWLEASTEKAVELFA